MKTAFGHGQFSQIMRIQQMALLPIAWAMSDWIEAGIVEHAS
jgi:hypothetical protein